MSQRVPYAYTLLVKGHCNYLVGLVEPWTFDTLSIVEPHWDSSWMDILLSYVMEIL